MIPRVLTHKDPPSVTPIDRFVALFHVFVAVSPDEYCILAFQSGKRKSVVPGLHRTRINLRREMVTSSQQLLRKTPRHLGLP
jgi:hypothetical protein